MQLGLNLVIALEAVKLGPTHYLPKPADADEILAALVSDTPLSKEPDSTNPP